MPSNALVESRSATAPPVTITKSRPPVVAWAVVGALLAAVEIFFILKWVTGPDFERIDAGSDDPPGWMRAVLSTGQVVLPIAGLVCIYLLLVRPWLRQRRITFDGLMCIAALLASPWDQLSNIWQHWWGYNGYLLNEGSVNSALPGVLALEEPGAGQGWSYLILPGVYVLALPLFAILGCKMMQSLKGRFPGLGLPSLIAICFAAMCVVDFVFEGVVFLKLGFWSYAGGHHPLLNGDNYAKLPLNEMLHAALLFTAPAVLRYVVNDKGQTMVERGSDRLRGGALKQAMVRMFAVIAGLHIILLVTYHVPQMLWSLNQPSWPSDVQQERSYFRNHACGPDVNRACPGPGVPISRPGSGYLDYSGNFVLPPEGSGN